ncbi:LYAR-type C2HC zinc finger-domain-containing protein [Scheffersomyces xylosifermentans]|uniref:LYAR-type C2HC zinc finger-domain-containing protein n=1 Tax=Scheffersomyces xylosifermentans TaxID=1304137 RepID=UPI00315CE375
MVSFSCEVCNDTVIKKKLDQHSQRCYGAYFTCIDCSTTFQGTSYRAHTSCISEAEKYEKALYKGPKKTPNVQNQKKPQQKQETLVEQKKEEIKTSKEETPSKKAESKKSKSKESKKESKKEITLAKYLDSKSEENLYKVIKKMSKDKSEELKTVLKSLKITKAEDGTIVIA